MKSNYTKKELFLEVWPGATAFPDYFNPNTTFFWEYGLSKYRDLVHYDGIWYDMNEIACLSRVLPCLGEMGDQCDPKDNYYFYKDLPYMPGYNEEIGRTNMAAGSINENGILYGTDDRKYAIYNTKPILSYMQNKLTYNFLKNKLNIRPFIISRSATIGTGKYCGHWLGDNYSNYKLMRNSVDGIFQFMIYGTTMTGDDICGFFDNSNAKLCNRWFNLGAFYPFSRNHNFNGATDHFPWSFNDDFVLNNIKNAINHRYMLLRYIYSHLFASSLNEKVGFFNPVFFYFPTEAESYNNMNDKIMVGDAFILFPLFTDETTDISRNFPSGKWNNFPNGTVILNEDDNRTKTLSGQFDVINLYMRGGYIVPWQNTFDKYIKNSHYLRQERMNLSINPDKDNKAKGLIFFDNDGIDTIENNDYIRIDLNYENGKLDVITKMKDGFNYEYQDNILGRVELYGTNNKEKCNIQITFSDGTVVNKSMEKEAENDKFYIDFSQEEKYAINNINNIQFQNKNN